MHIGRSISSVERAYAVADYPIVLVGLSLRLEQKPVILGAKKFYDVIIK